MPTAAITEPIAGRPCRVVGDASPSRVWLLFHGFTQTGRKHWFKYTDFPRHTRLMDRVPTGWRFYFGDGRNQHWSSGDDRSYVRSLFMAIRRSHPHADISVAGFSMGGMPVGWCMQDFPGDVHKAIAHSALWSTIPDNEVPVMGVITKSEHVPHFPLVNFNACPSNEVCGRLPQFAKRDPLAEIAKELPKTHEAYDEVMDALSYSRGFSSDENYGGMQSMYNRAANSMANFRHAVPTGNHRAPIYGHRWWHEHNSEFLNWLAQPRTH